MIYGTCPSQPRAPGRVLRVNRAEIPVAYLACVVCSASDRRGTIRASLTYWCSWTGTGSSRSPRPARAQLRARRRRAARSGDHRVQLPGAPQPARHRGINRLGPQHAEIKSMHTAEAARGRGPVTDTPGVPSTIITDATDHPLGAAQTVIRPTATAAHIGGSRVFRHRRGRRRRRWLLGVGGTNSGMVAALVLPGGPARAPRP
jgi:hypothetical protein